LRGGGVYLNDPLLASLRGQVVDIICGSFFLCAGLAAFSIGAIRRRTGARIFLLLGLWSVTYGAMQLSQAETVVKVSPHWLQVTDPYLNTAMTYMIVVIGALCFSELSRGAVRLTMQVVAIVGLAIAVVGFLFFVFTGAQDKLIRYNNLLAACLLVVLTVVVAVPGLARKYLVLSDRGVLAVCTLVFATEALFVNLLRPLGFNSPHVLDHLGFGILLFSFGYGGLQLVLTNERRLLSIENELTIAREIQTSILPDHVPELNHLRVAAAYRPMTAVAGDFYEFIARDKERVGFLVADVSGHGVPAALIASMIKVAAQSVEPCADDPHAVLCGLNRALARQLRGQFVTAAYLWIDTENGKAIYSAAGHPPLLHWRHGKLERIESNALLFGVTTECGNYPVRTIPMSAGDRFLLYTDGVTEPENARGEAFGDHRLEQVVRDHQSLPSTELSEHLLSELRRWQPETSTQADDITLIVIDVV
jgi:sigma-B regulation protein RsbU (phosphoserine phosphatase)